MGDYLSATLTVSKEYGDAVLRHFERKRDGSYIDEFEVSRSERDGSVRLNWPREERGGSFPFRVNHFLAELGLPDEAYLLYNDEQFTGRFHGDESRIPEYTVSCYRNPFESLASQMSANYGLKEIEGMMREAFASMRETALDRDIDAMRKQYEKKREMEGELGVIRMEREGRVSLIAAFPKSAFDEIGKLDLAMLENPIDISRLSPISGAYPGTRDRVDFLSMKIKDVQKFLASAQNGEEMGEGLAITIDASRKVLFKPDKSCIDKNPEADVAFGIDLPNIAGEFAKLKNSGPSKRMGPKM